MNTTRRALVALTLVVITLAPVTALSYTSHFFNSVEVNLPYSYTLTGGHSPQGNILAVGGRFYNSATSGYSGWIAVSDLSTEPPAYKLLKLLKDRSCTEPQDVVVTAVTAEDNGNLYVGGYAQYSDETTKYYFVAMIGGSPGGSYTLNAIRYYNVGEIKDLELAIHPYYGKVLLAVAADSNGNYPVMLILDPTDLSIENYIASNYQVWNQNGVTTAAISIDSYGDLVVIATLNSQGHIALFKWNPSSNDYTQAYVIKYLNGLYIHDVLVNEEDGTYYAYIAAEKSDNSYTDWGTGSDSDPVLIKVDLQDMALGNPAFEWVVVFDNDDDDHGYAVALYDTDTGSSDRIVLYGSLAHSGYSGNQYPLIAVVAPDGSVESAAMAPAPTSSDYSKPRGEYFTGSVYNGYTFAMGTTGYSNTAWPNVGLLLYSNEISNQLDWQGSISWPPVTVLKDLTGIATITKRTDINPSTNGPYAASTNTPLSSPLTCIVLNSINPTVYTANDNIIPEPVPEPWYAAIAVAVIALVLAVFYHRR